MYTLMANCFEWVRKRKEPNRAITLVIIGLDDAGKTTMVASLQGEPPDGITPTIGFANAEFTMNRCKVTVYDLGGGVRIRDVWRKYYAEVYGVVFVVDSCNTERFDETKDVLHKVVEHDKILGKPILIFANKQDKEGALVAEDVVNVLDLENQSQKCTFPYKVFTCSALKGYGRNLDKNINGGFQWILNTISSEFEKISARVEHDVAIQKEEEEREKKARMERIKKIREERDRREREAGRDPDKEESDDDVMIANPFQPIGKHLENLKSKDRKKKIDKEKKQKLEQARIEVESKEENTQVETSLVKKKKKKKKKVLKPPEEDSIKAYDNSEGNDDGGCKENNRHEIIAESPNDDQRVVVKKKRKVKKKHRDSVNDNDSVNVISEKRAVSVVEDEGHVLEELHNSDNEGNVIIVKKKKKKPKVRSSQENLTGDEDHLHVSPTTKKGKKKKRIISNEAIDSTANNFDSEVSLVPERKHEDLADNISPVENNELVESVRQKKPKAKKKRKKRNKTAPIDSLPEEDDVLQQILPPPVWKTPTTSWTSLPPISSNAESSALGSLPPLRSSKGRKGLSDSSLEAPVSPNWTRTRPNSEDVDIVT